MNFHVEFTKKSLKQLKKMDKQTSAMILGWIRKNLDGCINPRLFGKSLTANLSEKWRYRVGSYRLISKIEDQRIVILILEVGHRRDIYGK